MSNELPDLDENVSFVVDSGAPVGPIAMRTIINSIRSGVRAPDVLVWWAGATDWVPFSSSTGLLDLLSDLPATEQPPPPADLDVDAELTTVVDELELQVPDDSPGHLATTVIDMGMVEQAQALVDEVGDEDSDTYAAEIDSGEVADLDDLDERFPEPEVITFGLVDDVGEDGDDEVDETEADEIGSAEEVTSDDDAGDQSDVDGVAAEEVDDLIDDDIESLVEDETVAHDDLVGDAEIDDDEVDPAEADADALLAREPRDMHPSAVWGEESSEEASEQLDVDVEVSELEGAADELDAEEVDLEDEVIEAPDVEEFDEDSMVEEPDVEEPDVEEPDVEEPEVISGGGLTGLFSSPVREERDEPADVEDDGVSSRATLETVGARIDALSSATRRSQPFGIDEESASEPFPEDVDLDTESDLEPESAAAWTDGADEVAAEPAVEPDHLGADDVESQDVLDDSEVDSEVESALPMVGENPDLDDRFARMVEASNAHQRRLDWVLRVDELLMDACIGSVVDRGFVLLDLDGLDVGQRAVFDRHGDSQHIRLSLEPLSPVIAGEPIDRHVKVTISWGRDVADADEAFATLRAEASDDEGSPGDFTSDVNMVSSSATTSVDLIWLARDFVTDDHAVDRSEIDASITAILHALERRWYELFSSAD